MGSIKENALTRDEYLPLARIIGCSFILMFGLGIYAEFAVRNQLINWKDADDTFLHIKGSWGQFNAGIAAWIIIIILDVVLSATFWVLFQRVNKPIALLMVSLRLLYVAIKGFSIVGLFLARDIYSLPLELERESAEQALYFLRMHHYGFAVGLVFFGLHLACLAILLLRVRGIARLTGWMVMFAGMGYCLNSLLGLFGPAQEQLTYLVLIVFIIPMTFAELTLGLGLWLRGNRFFPLLSSEKL